MNRTRLGLCLGATGAIASLLTLSHPAAATWPDPDWGWAAPTYYGPGGQYLECTVSPIPPANNPYGYKGITCNATNQDLLLEYYYVTTTESEINVSAWTADAGDYAWMYAEVECDKKGVYTYHSTKWVSQSASNYNKTGEGASAAETCGSSGTLVDGYSEIWLTNKSTAPYN